MNIIALYILKRTQRENFSPIPTDETNAKAMQEYAVKFGT